MRNFSHAVVLSIALAAACPVFADSTCCDRYRELANLDAWSTPDCLAFSASSRSVMCTSRREIAAGYDRRSLVLLEASGTRSVYPIHYEADLTRREVEERAEPAPTKLWSIEAVMAELAEAGVCEPLQPGAELPQGEWTRAGRLELRLEVQTEREEDWETSFFTLHARCDAATEAQHVLGGSGRRAWLFSAPDAGLHAVAVEDVEAGEGIFDKQWTPHLLDEHALCRAPAAP